jgi:hypothetical protein
MTAYENVELPMKILGLKKIINIFIDRKKYNKLYNIGKLNDK